MTMVPRLLPQLTCTVATLYSLSVICWLMMRTSGGHIMACARPFTLHTTVIHAGEGQKGISRFISPQAIRPKKISSCGFTRSPR